MRTNRNLTRQDYETAAEREYARAADEYAVRDEKKWSQPTATISTLAAVVEELTPRDILELGVGTGRYFPYLKGETYTGIDISTEMLAYARQREALLQKLGFRSVTLLNEEVNTFLTGLPATASFDFIFSIGCVGVHIPISLPLLESIQRVLRPGGSLFLQTAQQAPAVWFKRSLQHAMNQLFHRPDNYSFFVSTTSKALKDMARLSGLEPVWIRQEAGRVWLGRPILLSLFRRNAL